MTEENLEAVIRDNEITGLGGNDLKVVIRADQNRENDFNKIRDAIKEILNND
ncbi:MAG: hypothetical protein ABEH81_00880 [Halopenitus sp.]